VLEPGGYHLMLDSVMQEFIAGDTFSITLTFASGMTLTVPVNVRDE
jgi:copper(I)-binding protein